MSDEIQPISILSETECWNLLSSVALGRIVTSVEGEAAIFPVNFVVQHHTVLFRTAVGTKLVSAAINNQVLFEADDHGIEEGWSVILKGTARILGTSEDIDEASTTKKIQDRRETSKSTETPKCEYIWNHSAYIENIDYRVKPEVGGGKTLGSAH